ncbi:hypothetical protein RB653_007568 [Dictyostelium firmibasis]|uniref:Uncharacterized protein n=1 Tax=Dictyostelium firmibasis TaxID=79012 RepID=A0AAN7YM53_9MYCE
MSIFAYSLLAGLAPLLSSSIPFFTLRNRNINASVFHILLCLSAGLLFAVATLELIPESMNLALRSLKESSTITTTITTPTIINGNIKLQKSLSDSQDSLLKKGGVIHSTSNDISKRQIENLNLNNLIQSTTNDEDNDNLDNDGENDVDNDDHEHDDGNEDGDDHDHEGEENKVYLKIPMYGIGFGFAVLIIVESIFSGIDGGHHSHSHGSLSSSTSNDVISDYISSSNNNDDDDNIELLERNIVNKEDNDNHSHEDEDIIVINKSIENTPNLTSPIMNKDSISNNSNGNTNSNNKDDNNINNNNNNSNNNNKSKNRKNESSKIDNKNSINNNVNNNNNKSKLTITTFIALSIHSFVDGVVISSAFSSSPHVGARVALAIVIHKIPDGLVLSSIILSQKKFNGGIFSNPFFYFLLISCMTPLGAFISSFLFGGLSLSSGAFVLGFGAGTFIYITSTAILPEILSNQIVKKSTSLISIFLGYLLFIFLDSQFHGAH